MDEVARQAVQQLGSSVTSALTNMPTSAQQVFDQRVSTVQVPTEGQLGEEQIAEEVVTDACDRMRADMRFSRTSAAITPQVFTDVLQHREQAVYERISTVRVEETGQEITASASTPTSVPKAFAPAYPPARSTTGPYTMDTSE